MQNTAYRITAFTAVISAFGFLLRWLQDMRIIDPETGLAARGMGISYGVAAVIAAAAVAFFIIALRLRRTDPPVEPELAFAGKSFLHTAVGILPALGLGLSGALQLLYATAEHYTDAGELTVHRIAGVLALAAAVCAAVLVTNAAKPEKAGARRIAAGILILFSGVWLVAAYKSAASDPVIWRFAVEILGICAAMMAFYHIAGYHFGQPYPFRAIFYCGLGAFLCAMSVIDEHPAGESLCYAAVTGLLLYWEYTLIATLRRGLMDQAQIEASPIPGTEN